MNIIGIILVFLALSSGSFLGATFFNKKYGEVLPITCFSLIVILYIAYIFNILLLGFWLVILLMLCCYIAGVINYLRSKTQKKTFLLNFFNPGMLIFIFFLIILYFFTKDFTVINFDELRLWGAYPKALYFTNQLQFGDSALMFDGMNVATPRDCSFSIFF